MVAGEEQLFRLKLKNLLFEIQQFLEDTLKEETLGGASNAQKNILISRITDFKKDHPDLQGAKEIARREVAPTIKRDKKDKKDKKDKRYTQDPTLKKGSKSTPLQSPPEDPPDLPDYDPVSAGNQIEDEEPTEDYETFENVMNAIPPEARPKPAEKGKDNKGRKISDSTPNLTVPKGNNEKPYVDIDIRVVDIENPDAAGYLLRKRKIFGRQRRWCVLKNGLLYIFQKEGDKKKPESCLKVDGYSSRSSYEPSTNLYTFVMVCTGKPTLEFWAENEADRLKWAYAIDELPQKKAAAREQIPLPDDEPLDGEVYEAAPEALDPRQSQISMLYDDIAHIQDAMAGMMPPKDEGVQPVLEEDELEYGDAETIAETLVVPTIKQGSLKRAERPVSQPQFYGNVEDPGGEPPPEEPAELLYYDEGMTMMPPIESEGDTYEPCLDDPSQGGAASTPLRSITQRKTSRQEDDTSKGASQNGEDLPLPTRGKSSLFNKIVNNNKSKSMVVEEANPVLPPRTDRKYEQKVPPPTAEKTKKGKNPAENELAAIIRARRAKITDGQFYEAPNYE